MMFVYVVIVDYGFYMEPDVHILKIFDDSRLARTFIDNYKKSHHNYNFIYYKRYKLHFYQEIS